MLKKVVRAARAVTTWVGFLGKNGLDLRTPTRSHSGECALPMVGLFMSVIQSTPSQLQDTWKPN